MVNVMDCNPFDLFPEQVETCELWKYKAAGTANEKLADNVRVIIKRSTNNDAPSVQYQSRALARRIHIEPSTLPESYAADPEGMLNLVFVTDKGRRYQVNDASRGDDMDEGVTRFLTVLAMPYGKNSQ
jgi:hypothetical protein